MLVLAKAAMAMMLGFIIALIAGLILIPILKRFKMRQTVSRMINERHIKKDGTPTLGGLIFISATLITLILLKFKGSIDISYNLLIILFVFLAYGLLGFADDFMKIKYHDNRGLSIMFKLLCQMVIALVFFYIYIKNGGSPTLEISIIGLNIDLDWLYGLFILFLLVGTSNAVNITDGLDGLCTGLSLIAFMAYGLLAWNAKWMEGYQEVGIFCFVLVGALLGFLMFNSNPAKVFMGDTGSLTLGATLATIAILTNHELSLAVIGGVFVIETLTVIIQITSVVLFKKKVFLMTPIHHHFERLNWRESDIVKLFWISGFILCLLALIYGVWL